MEQQKDQQSTNQETPKNQETQKFDVNKVSKSTWIYVIIAAVGLLGVFLPWVRVSIFGFSASASGLKAWQGVISLIVLLVMIVIAIAGNQLKIKEESKKKILTISAYIPALLSLLAFLGVLAEQYASAGIGLILTLFASIALVLIGHNVIRLK